MVEYKIEKSVPVTPRKLPRNKCKYPFPLMEPGDSFFVAMDSGVNLNSMRSSAHQYGHKHGWGIQTRVVEGGVRIWRVS